MQIVDLIRSDLLSACPPSSVQVPKLIALESYGVHNLVTTVRGELAPNVGVVEAVRRCFPPGSMTGAPKLRSVRLLEGFEEGQKRGVYSGTLRASNLYATGRTVDCRYWALKRQGVLGTFPLTDRPISAWLFGRWYWRVIVSPPLISDFSPCIHAETYQSSASAQEALSLGFLTRSRNGTKC